MIGNRLTLAAISRATFVGDRLRLFLRFVLGRRRVVMEMLEQPRLLIIRQLLTLATEHLTRQPRHLPLQLHHVLRHLIDCRAMCVDD